jgi:mono/diheme cytochrome c family protein
MSTKWLILNVRASIGFGAAGEQARISRPPKVPAGWKFRLPDGDPEYGRQAYLRMDCAACHIIRSPGLRLPEGGGTDGPDLTGYSNLPKEYLAESIIRAHTAVAAPGYVFQKGKAGMGKYNHFMTIQELVDLVAFLKENS